MDSRIAAELIEKANITFNIIDKNKHRTEEVFDKGKTFDCDVIGVVSGCYRYQVDGESYTVPAGYIFFVPEGCRFSGMALQPSSHYFCHFTVESPIRFRPGLCGEEMLVRLFCETCSKPEDPLPLKCVLRLLLYHYAKTASVSDKELPPGIRNAVERIHREPGVYVTGKELARIANMNYSYFSRRFHECIGVSPHTYCDNLRMEEARRMIRAGAGVKETAEKLGFPDMFTFSKKFKKHFRTPPSRFSEIDV